MAGARAENAQLRQRMDALEQETRAETRALRTLVEAILRSPNASGGAASGALR